MSLKGLFHPINDVTTSFDPVPELKSGTAYPLRFRAVQNDLYPDLKAFTSRLEPEALYVVALETARAQSNWEITDSDSAKRRIHAVARTPLMRFADDVTIEVRDGDGGATLHMRSRSRLGRNDFGANANRIRAYFKAVESALKRK
jgi:hypothetical protein